MCKWGAVLFVAFESKVSRRKMSNVGGRFFGVVMRVDSLMECCLGELTGSIKDVVVVEMVGGDC